MSRILDLRPRCGRRRCNKLIRRGKRAQAEHERYTPYCSFHCQEWARLEDAQDYLDRNFPARVSEGNGA